MKIQIALPVLLGGLLFSGLSMAESDGPQEARGIVFDDTNRNGVRDEGEKGIPDIRVSNGREIVATDDQGRYKLPVDNDTILFVIKPRNWMTPVDEDNLPQFYYVHKPNGSPDLRYAGVEPTGPLPESIDFPLYEREEPDTFKALLFGDTQSRNLDEVEHMTHDIVEQVIREDAHGAAFGVTLGDIVFDDLSVFEPHNNVIGLIGIPWYNVIGNHDLNFDAEDDHHSDETFERLYGPAYYSFDHGPVHFMVLDDVVWVGPKEEERGRYFGGLGEKQMDFIRNDLSMIPEDQLIVLMMHIPLVQVEDRKELYELIQERPASMSISAHRHFHEHRLIGEEDGWLGPERHHHVINVTVCGSWWSGTFDERGIPHATMSDGAPNGYSIFTFDGQDYGIEFRAASRPADYQMAIHAPEVIKPSEAETTVVMVNVFNGSVKSKVAMRVGKEQPWTKMEQITAPDPAFQRLKDKEEDPPADGSRTLPKPHATNHLWRGTLPSRLEEGAHTIEVRTVDMFGNEHSGHRIIRVEAPDRR